MASRFDGRTYDCGSRLGFLTANVAFALDRGDLAPGLKEELRRLGFAGEVALDLRAPAQASRCRDAQPRPLGSGQAVFQPRRRMINSGP